MRVGRVGLWQFAEDGNAVDLPAVPRKARTGGYGWVKRGWEVIWRGWGGGRGVGKEGGGRRWSGADRGEWWYCSDWEASARGIDATGGGVAGAHGRSRGRGCGSIEHGVIVIDSVIEGGKTDGRNDEG